MFESLFSLLFHFLLFFILFSQRRSSIFQFMDFRRLWNRAVLSLTPGSRQASPRNNKYIPDEILLIILGKLPAESVQICRCVCRRWKVLISTMDCVELPPRFRIPRIIFMDKEYGKMAVIGTVDPWGGEARKYSKRSGRVIKIHKMRVDSIGPIPAAFHPYLLGNSYTGLLIFILDLCCGCSRHFILDLCCTCSTHFILVNPLTREDVRLITPARGLIIGVFLNPFTRDQYRVLWLGSDLRPNGSLDYRIIYLGGGGGGGDGVEGSKSVTQRQLYDEDDALVSYRPRVTNTVVMVDDVLYWMVGCRYATSTLRTPGPDTELDHSCAESILTFNTKTEKFSAMPHPGHHDQWCIEDPGHERMHLVEMMNDHDHGVGSGLCLFDVNLDVPVIDVWILKRHGGDDGNYNEPSWVRWLKFDLHRFFTMKNPYKPSDAKKWILPTAIFNSRVYLTLNRGEAELLAINLNGDTYQTIKAGKTHFHYCRPWGTFSPCLVPIGISKSWIKLT